jgi:hypothetical protein
LRHYLPAQRLPFGSQSAPLGVGEMRSLPARPELVFKDTVFFSQISDHARLATADPASERSQEELQMDGVNQTASVSEVRQGVALWHDQVSGHNGRGDKSKRKHRGKPSRERRRRSVDGASDFSHGGRLRMAS